MLSACWNLQHAPLAHGIVGGGRVGCQVLQGVQDGFCGCLTTVSTWVMESRGSQRKDAYFYGLTSVGLNLAAMAVGMGTWVWTKGVSDPVFSIWACLHKKVNATSNEDSSTGREAP